MKIVKRDGRTVEYDSLKIRVAIEKANNEVSESDKISDSGIKRIISYIESLDKKRMLVEDIQDIIEKKLMEFGNYELAKKYIIYRYKRSIIRQSNTTDASILSLLKNNDFSDGDYLMANRQRDVMAGEASKDLAYRLLLPQNVTVAEKERKIKFCNVEYFTEPIIESVKVNLSSLLENGTVINGVKIESPKSFQSACNVLVEIIANLAFCQTGNIYIELKDLFGYYYLSYEKKYSMYEALMKSSLVNEQIRAITESQMFLEIQSGIQTIFYQINTITMANGLVPKIYFLVDTKDITSEAEEKIVYEFIKQKIRGIKDENGIYFIPEYPAIIYSKTDDDRCEYITQELLDSKSDYTLIDSKNFDNFKKKISRFNQGSMILNLANIAEKSKERGEDFIESVEKCLTCCYEGFLCRNHNLQGIYSDKSPLHWRYGAIARLENKQKIDMYLKKEHSFMNLSVVGFELSIKILDNNQDLKSKIRELIVGKIDSWNKENSFEVVLSNYYNPQEVSKMLDKKYVIEEYYDSCEFMREGYFKDGMLYFRTHNKESYKDDVLNSDLIVKIEH